MTYKYLNLQRHLENCHEDAVKMTFSEIESLVGTLLDSAYKHPAACWNNGGHNSFSKSWYYAGYHAAVDMAAQTVEFTRSCRRIRPQPPNSQTKKTVDCILDEDRAVLAIKEYHNTTTDGSHTRYLSWSHCYRAFQENWPDGTKLEYLSLHLAWYLASWGMLRNSFLLNHDYLVHKEVVGNLCNGEFAPLFNRPSVKQVPLVLQAADTVKKSYARGAISDTLLSKILLGIFGCVPAYDRYFKYAARKYKVCSGLFGEQSLTALWQYYAEHNGRLESLRNQLAADGISYPPMKLMDMCLWQIGFAEDRAAKSGGR